MPLLHRISSTLRGFVLASGFALLTHALPVAADDNALPQLGDSVSASVTPEQEYRLGRAWMRQLRGATPMVSDPLVQDYVEHLAYRLAFHSPLSNPDLVVNLINDTSINAFAVPGGVIGVNVGLIIYAESESEVAAVLAHELGHLSQRHFARSVAAQKRDQWLYLGALLASIALAAKSNSDLGMAGIATTQAASVQSQLSFSRADESEADRVGMQTLVDSGMDPHAMPEFFERLQRQSGESLSIPEFLSDHPVTEARIADTLNRANKYPQRLAQDSFDYQAIRARILVRYTDESGNGVAHYQQALRSLKPGSEAYNLQALGLALALTQNRQYKEAREALKPLLATDPQRVDYLIAASDIDFAERKYADIVSRLQKPLTLNPDNYPLLMYYARARIADGHPQAVIDTLEAEARERPDDPAIWDLLVDAYTGTKNAIGVYRSKAEVYFMVGNDERALEQLRLASNQTRDNYPLNAKIQKRMREMQQAKADMKS
jgi:predicted Zn-dependent protease